MGDTLPWWAEGVLFFLVASVVLSLIEAVREAVRLIRRKWDL